MEPEAVKPPPPSEPVALDKLGFHQLERDAGELYLRCVHTPLQRKARDCDLGKDYFGMPLSDFRSVVLNYGRDPFLSPFLPEGGGRTISRVHKVLGYCFLNMRQHQIAAQAVYSRYTDYLDLFFGGQRPLVIDCGCGPSTAGLALAHTRKVSTGAPADILYLGIDYSPAMILRARRFMKEAKRCTSPLLSSTTRSAFGRSVKGISDEWLSTNVPAGTPVLILCSYFFGSHHGTVTDVTELVARLNRSLPGSTIGLIHTNTPNPEKNQRYEEFRRNVPTLRPIASGLAQFEYLAYKEIRPETVFFELLLNKEFTPAYTATGWRPKIDRGDSAPPT